MMGGGVPRYSGQMGSIGGFAGGTESGKIAPFPRGAQAAGAAVNLSPR